MLSRKTYEAHAAIIRKRLGEKLPETMSPVAVLKTIAGDLADHFESDNPRFDRERFLAACNPSN